jgi:hypothetical protein
LGDKCNGLHSSFQSVFGQTRRRCDEVHDFHPFSAAIENFVMCSFSRLKVGLRLKFDVNIARNARDVEHKRSRVGAASLSRHAEMDVPLGF